MTVNLEPTLPREARRSRVDLIVAFSVILISMTSLFIALKQSRVMEKQLAASVWPYVEFDNSNYDPERKEAAISLSLDNVGIGPARIVALSLRYDGKPVTGWQELIKACCNPEGLPISNIVSSPAPGRVLPADQTLRLFRFLRNPEDEVVWKRLNTERYKIDGQVCYCSVFDDCYVYVVNAEKALPVKNCDAAAKEIQYRE